MLIWSGGSRKSGQRLAPVPAGTGWKAMIHPVVWLITITYFLSIMGGYGLMLWMPTIVKTLGIGSARTGLLLMIPNFVAVFALIYAGWISDRLQNRKIVVFVSSVGVLVGLLGLLWLARAHVASVWLTILFMTIATAAGFAKQAPIWAIPTQILPAGAAGLGLAVIGLVGNLGGLTGPWLMGYLRATTHSFLIGFLALAGCVALSAFLTLFIPEKKPIDLQAFRPAFWRARKAAVDPRPRRNDSSSARPANMIRTPLRTAMKTACENEAAGVRTTVDAPCVDVGELLASRGFHKSPCCTSAAHGPACGRQTAACRPGPRRPSHAKNPPCRRAAPTPLRRGAEARRGCATGARSEARRALAASAEGRSG